jgi:FAD binding domain-containing protein/D-arabinono-1,4-lactone oxidase
MVATIVNYDGSITTTPRQVATPRSVSELQAILRDTASYPGPVRAKGSYHSLTPCASTDGTLVDMSQMAQVISIDTVNNTCTAQAGLQVIDAARALRAQNRQLITNIEIGNMTLGSAACCHTKDALDGIEFGQVSSYVTRIKWVTPTGDLAQADQASDPDLLCKMRSSYGLGGIVYEVTFGIKPVEALHFTYLPRPIAELTQPEVETLLDSSEGLICWTVGRTCVFQQRHSVQDAGILGALEAAARRAMWSYGAAHIGHFIDQFVSDKSLRDAAQTLNFDVDQFLYSGLHLFGGLTMLAPDKIIDYHNTPRADRYAFTFWAFPRSRWLDVLRAYMQFAEDYFKMTGFRCNMPLGSYHIRRDRGSLLSYTFDGEIVSIDPIHASTDNDAWHAFLRAFNEFAFQHGGTPLLNQSPFVQRKHVEAAYGQRWLDFSHWVKSVDPSGRMLNPFFADLLST